MSLPQARYVSVTPNLIPAGVYFYLAPEQRLQQVQVAYGGYGPDKYFHGAPFMRRLDKRKELLQYEYFALVQQFQRSATVQ